jgi:hypothetical protein
MFEGFTGDLYLGDLLLARCVRPNADGSLAHPFTGIFGLAFEPGGDFFANRSVTVPVPGGHIHFLEDDRVFASVFYMLHPIHSWLKQDISNPNWLGEMNVALFSNWKILGVATAFLGLCCRKTQDGQRQNQYRHHGNAYDEFHILGNHGLSPRLNKNRFHLVNSY